MDSPQPIILGVHTPVFIIKRTEENHLESMISQEDECTVLQGMRRVRIVFKDDVGIHENETDVDLKKNGDKGQPVDVLSVEFYEIYLVSILFLLVVIAIVRPSKRALNLSLKDECPS